MAYIIKWETPNTDIVNPVFEDVTIVNESPIVQGTVSRDGTVAFYGTYNPRHLSGASSTLLCFGTDDEVYYPAGPMTIGALRGYFSLAGLNVPGKPTVEKIVLIFDEDHSGIRDVSDSKVRHPGDDAWYDLAGRRLNGKPTEMEYTSITARRSP